MADRIPLRGATLYPYQRDGARFLASREGAFLFDEQGLGKTAQAIRAADWLLARRIVIVCPAAVKENWRREVHAFSVAPRRVDVVEGRKHKFDPTAEVLIVNYDIIATPHILSNLRRIGPEVVIIDEAHYLKNPEAKRTKAVLGPKCDSAGGVIEGARVFALTGTPIPNNVAELWPLLRAIAPDAIRKPGGQPMRKHEFESTYLQTIQTSYGPRVVGSRNLSALREKLKGVALRRLKKDVLPELPPFRVVETTLSPDAAARRSLLEAQREPGVDQLMNDLQAANGDPARIADILQAAAPFMPTVRRITGILKAPLVADFVTSELEGGVDKMVVFALHKQVIATLHDTLARRKYRPVVLAGGVSAQARQAAIDSFQSDPGVRVFIGQITAAGTGITLTAASHALFAEMSWVPADNAQAAMRVHRIGQQNAVLVRLATLTGSIDEYVAQAVRRKAKDIAELLS